MKRIGIVVALLALLGGALAGLWWWQSRPVDSPSFGPAEAALAELVTAEPSDVPGYQRDAFGAGWKDPDRNGCDARNDTLRRDLTDVVLRPGTQDCVVEAGTLRDPYTGQTLAFVKGPDSALVQIDHVVPLSLAWSQGAWGWNEDRRVEFANDPLNLLATTQEANLSKGDSDASQWLPPDQGFVCAYVARQIAVKVAYELPVWPAERAAIQDVLDECPGQDLPS